MKNLNYKNLPFQITKWTAWSPALTSQEAWETWANGVSSVEPFAQGQDPSPSVSFLPIGMRKKLSELCKLVLYLCHNTLEQQNNIRIVMASRFGESDLTFNLLESVAKREMPSPMVFSRSVLNSALGLYSIFSKNKYPNVCISAMEDTFSAGLFESLTQLHSYQEKILFIYVEEKMLEVYKPFVQDPPVSYGAAFLLEKGEKALDGGIDCLSFLREAIKNNSIN